MNWVLTKVIIMKRGVTVQDIADYCGLSKSTVAYVLREPSTCKATAATKEKVFTAACKLGYRPNSAARSLSTRRYRTIGVLMPPFGGYYNELMVHLDNEMNKYDYYGVFSFWELKELKYNTEAFKYSFSKLCNHGIDGIITVEYNQFLAKSDIPIVIYGNQWPSFDCVYPDKVLYMKETVEYLYRHGHRKIGFLGLTNEIRAEVLRKELLRYQLPVNEDWLINSPAVAEHGEKSMRKLLSLPQRPDAIILHSDLMMSGVLLAANEAGVRIPKDISVISYDNLQESRYFIPPLTTFDQCLRQAAKILVETMLRRIDNPQMPQCKQSFKMPLVERKSVINRKNARE